MKKIDLFERAIAEQAGSLEDYGINSTLFALTAAAQRLATN